MTHSSLSQPTYGTHSDMIVGTNYSPSKAFIAFAREFFEAVAVDDWRSALGKLDVSAGTKWSKKTLDEEITKVLLGDKVCSAEGFTRSASPQLKETDTGSYKLVHRIPANGVWSEAEVVFEFVRKKGTGYYHVFIDEVRRA